jgi:hypothetical protein
MPTLIMAFFSIYSDVEPSATHKNNFYVRAPSVLPSDIRDTSRSLVYFKNSSLNYYFNLLEYIYDPDNPKTFKSVKCHTTRSLHCPSVRSF